MRTVVIYASERELEHSGSTFVEHGNSGGGILVRTEVVSLGLEKAVKLASPLPGEIVLNSMETE